ncbi:MAG: nucleotide exchange factor GrpE [Gammaproteobacteria bacterium]|nr:nucleotide exchange factor GrpE [Gammaproteobacteria bacterium]
MNDKETLLEQFRGYLEEYQEEITEKEQTDLFSLFSEMAALRNEVKLESRQFKTSLDHFKSGFDGLKSSFDGLHAGQDELTRELAQCHGRSRETVRGMLLDFLEVYDRLAEGVTQLNSYTPSSSWFRSSKEEVRFIQGMQEGQAMLLRRFDQMLARYQVCAMEALDKPLDPHRMRAVEVDNRPDLENGVVTGELRKGFLWKEEVLRLAEVKVNKVKDI